MCQGILVNRHYLDIPSMVFLQPFYLLYFSIDVNHEVFVLSYFPKTKAKSSAALEPKQDPKG